MALTIVDFDEEEEKIIKVISEKLQVNKPKAVKKIVLVYGGMVADGNTE